MSIPFNQSLDLNWMQLRHLRWENLSSAPTGSKGSVYFNTTNNTFYGHNGTTWSAFASSGSTSWSSITGTPTTLSGYGITDANNIYPWSTTFTTTAGGWYRVATSPTGVGRCSGDFWLHWTVNGCHGSIKFQAGCHYNATTGVSLIQLDSAGYSQSSGFTKARLVYYPGTYTGEYCYLEVYCATALTNVTVYVQTVRSIGWSIIDPSTAGSIPANYSSKELTFYRVDGFSSGQYTKLTLNEAGQITAAGTLSVSDMPGIINTFGSLANAEGCLLNNGAGTLSYQKAMPIDSYTTLGVPNFGVNGTSVYGYKILSNRGIAFDDTRGLSWKAGFFSTDAYFGISQDAGVASSFKPFIIGDGAGNQWLKIDPVNTLSTFAGNITATGSGKGVITANSFVKSGGTSSQLLMADGTVTKKRAYLKYALTEAVSNTDKYFYSYVGIGGTQDDSRRSSNTNGMTNQNGCNPIQVTVSGTITTAILRLMGAATASATVSYPVTYSVEVWNVGTSGEGTSLGTIQFSISNTYTVGTYSLPSPQTNATITTTGLSISVTAGMMIALKFKNSVSPSTVAISQMAFTSLIIEET